jgi:peroxiredoxin
VETPAGGAPTVSPTVTLPWFWTQSEEGTAASAIAHYEHGVPDLSPQPLLPSFWTKHEEGSAASWIAQYEHGATITDPYAASAPPRQPADRLIGQPLPQTRFLGTSGSVLDLAGYQREHRPLVVVLMRGFAGQVCLYCAAQTVALCNHIDEFHAAGAEVVIIYPGPAESAPAFLSAVASLRKDPVSVPVALDVSLQLVRGLGVESNLAKPTSLVLDRAGVVRYAYIGQTMADRPSVEDLLHAVHGIVE